LQCLIQKKFHLYFFSLVLVIKALDPYLDQYSLEMLDPDPDSMNLDLQLCFLLFFVGNVCLLDLDSESRSKFRIQIRISSPDLNSESGSTDLIEFESHPDPKHFLFDADPEFGTHFLDSEPHPMLFKT
jgi:hypothetical protein